MNTEKKTNMWDVINNNPDMVVACFAIIGIVTMISLLIIFK